MAFDSKPRLARISDWITEIFSTSYKIVNNDLSLYTCCELCGLSRFCVLRLKSVPPNMLHLAYTTQGE